LVAPDAHGLHPAQLCAHLLVDGALLHAAHVALHRIRLDVAPGPHRPARRVDREGDGALSRHRGADDGVGKHGYFLGMMSSSPGGTWRAPAVRPLRWRMAATVTL